MKISVRQQWFLVCLAALALTGASFYFEWVVGLVPCPLCMMQRLLVLLMAVLALIAFIHQPRTLGQRVYSVLLACFAMTGLVIATRQTWLQHLPADKIPPCGPGLNVILNYMPAEELLRALFWGGGDCAKVDWTFLSLSMSNWMIFVFLGFLAAAIFLVKDKQWTFYNN